MLNMLGCDRLIRMRAGIPSRSGRGVSPILVVAVLCASSSQMKILALVLPPSDVVVSLRSRVGKALAEVFDRVVADPDQVVMAQGVLLWIAFPSSGVDISRHAPLLLALFVVLPLS